MTDSRASSDSASPRCGSPLRSSSAPCRAPVRLTTATGSSTSRKPDPHLGTEAEFAAFMSCAKKLGLKVFLDVVVNHTADVISYPQGTSYVSLGRRPYRTAKGRAFNPWTYTSGTSVPEAGAPAELRQDPDRRSGHAKREGADGPEPGDAVPQPRRHRLGQLRRPLRDGRRLLRARRPHDRGLDGGQGAGRRLRVMDHEVRGRRLPDRHCQARRPVLLRPMAAPRATDRRRGREAVLHELRRGLATRTRPSSPRLDAAARQLPSVLDFPFQETARTFLTGTASGGSLAALFAEDDYYTSPTTNAYGLTTFLGNHDMGRIGFFLATQSGDEGQSLLERDLLAHDLLYLTRGVPVVYYGDEVGMTGSGDGTDKKARQDMFATQVPEWREEQRIGSAADRVRLLVRGVVRTRGPHGCPVGPPRGPSGARLGRDDHPLRSGPGVRSQPHRRGRPGPSTWWPSTPGTLPRRWPSLPRPHPAGGRRCSKVAGPPRTAAGRFPSLSRRDRRSSFGLTTTLPLPSPPSIAVRSARDFVTGRYRLTASVPGADPSTVTFVKRRVGSSQWTTLGSDDARPFRVYRAASEGRKGRDCRCCPGLHRSRRILVPDPGESGALPLGRLAGGHALTAPACTIV